MQFNNLNMYRWLVNIPYGALERAYQASKTVRNIQKDYLYYKNSIGSSSRRSWYNVGIYLDSVLNQSASKIYWNLLVFKITIYIVNKASNLLNIKRKNTFLTEDKKNPINNNISDFQNTTPLNRIKKEIQNSKFRITKIDQGKYTVFLNESKLASNKNWYLQNIPYVDTENDTSYWGLTHKEIDDLNRKLAWIEAVLADLDLLKNEAWGFYTLMSQYSNKLGSPPFSLAPFLLRPKDIPYESLGLVPRSITRTLSRFQTELEGRSASLVLPEFRLAKYQAVASLQYMIFLLICPWVLSITCKVLFIEPWIQNWWNTGQSQVFLSFSQEEKALRRLQEVEELLWLDIIMADSSTRQPQDLSAQIHQKTIDLVEQYNQESINTVLNLFTNLITIIVIIFLLIWGKKRLAIFNSWIQEVFYSLSDTMKAFFILLLTDLCIGFHSPHGWEIFIGFLLEHLGFSHNKHIISCFVSTFPVILDTVFKYWIFRHLNRISPSIVVSYHTMNE